MDTPAPRAIELGLDTFGDVTVGPDGSSRSEVFAKLLMQQPPRGAAGA